MRITAFFYIFFTVAITSCNSQIINPRDKIVLVNVDTLNRKGIADEINIINSLNPKVIAIDLQFSNDTKRKDDYLLLLALEKVKNLVMISVIEDYDGREKAYRRFALGSLPEYLLGAKTGFGNTILEGRPLELRKFSVHENVNGGIEYHFAVRTAMAFDSLAAAHFVERSPRIVDIDYDYGKKKFKSFSSSEVLKRAITRADIEGKIVLLGFLGPGDEDKFFTPLNTNPMAPDTYGLEYLACIVAQVLENK